MPIGGLCSLNVYSLLSLVAFVFSEINATLTVTNNRKRGGMRRLVSSEWRISVVDVLACDVNPNYGWLHAKAIAHGSSSSASEPVVVLSITHGSSVCRSLTKYSLTELATQLYLIYQQRRAMQTAVIGRQLEVSN